MAIELWGILSVRDHLVERPLLADVLLYDHLVADATLNRPEASQRLGAGAIFHDATLWWKC